MIVVGFENGVRMDRDETPEEAKARAEREKWEQEHPPQPTMEERLAALEEENRLLKEKLNQVEILTGGDSV